ncbi:hypothetical protein Pelo_18752 [Pelomyxa schiedti]|nr:hypothetical protein Pelo_18752 [Pelomyxa schiedti]
MGNGIALIVVSALIRTVTIVKCQFQGFFCCWCHEPSSSLESAVLFVLRSTSWRHTSVFQKLHKENSTVADCFFDLYKKFKLLLYIPVTAWFNRILWPITVQISNFTNFLRNPFPLP